MTPWPWLVIGLAVVVMTVGTLAYAEPVALDCSDQVTYEAHWERVECYLAVLAGQSDEGYGGATRVLADVAPVALVVGAVLAAIGLARVGGAAVR